MDSKQELCGHCRATPALKSNSTVMRQCYSGSFLELKRLAGVGSCRSVDGRCSVGVGGREWLVCQPCTASVIGCQLAVCGAKLRFQFPSDFRENFDPKNPDSSTYSLTGGNWLASSNSVLAHVWQSSLTDSWSYDAPWRHASVSLYCVTSASSCDDCFTLWHFTHNATGV